MSRREFAADLVCAQREQIPLMLAMMMVMGVLLLFSFLFIEPGTASYAIALVDLVLLVVGVTTFAAVYRLCAKREMDSSRTYSSERTVESAEQSADGSE